LLQTYVFCCFASIFILFFATPAEFAGSTPSPPATRAASPDDHDRDDGVAESPYMLIQGFSRLTN
jgi:hypothetical protein